MLNEISDNLQWLGDGISRLPDGQAKVGLLERLLATYDKFIGMLKEKVEQHQAKAASGRAGEQPRPADQPAPSSRPGGRRRSAT